MSSVFEQLNDVVAVYTKSHRMRAYKCLAWVSIAFSKDHVFVKLKPLPKD